MSETRPPLPFLDRLLDEEPDAPRDPGGQFPWDWSRTRAALARDLEMLLNTRALAACHLEDFPGAERSVLAYGLEDLNGFSLQDPNARMRLQERVMEVLRTHEPRLRDAEVRLEASGTSPNHLAFRIQARLAPGHAVAFDARFHLGSQRCRVQQA